MLSILLRAQCPFSPMLRLMCCLYSFSLLQFSFDINHIMLLSSQLHKIHFHKAPKWHDLTSESIFSNGQCHLTMLMTPSWRHLFIRLVRQGIRLCTCGSFSVFLVDLPSVSKSLSLPLPCAHFLDNCLLQHLLPMGSLVISKLCATPSYMFLSPALASPLCSKLM